MKKLAVLMTIVFVCASVCAQPAKKVRHTASNTKEAVTERQISSRFNTGLRAYYTAQYGEAEQTFSGILTVAPKHAPSYYMLSRVYELQQRYTEAESAIRQAVKLDKNNIWYQVALAQICMTNGNFKEAQPIWERVCREYPDNLEFLSYLARCYEKTGNAAKAEELFVRIAQLMPEGQTPNDTGVSSSEEASGGSKVKGFALLQVKDYAKAVVLLEEALREDDTDYDLWSAFAEAATKSGRWTMLTGKEEDMTTLFPQSATLLAALANAFLQVGENEKAVEYYKQALAFSFDADLTKEIRQGLHEAYTRMGDSDNAARYR
jgi:predicted Zn-dependent protease